MPIGVVVVVLGARHVPESSGPSRRHIDYPAPRPRSVFLAGVTFGLIEARVLGWWSPAVVAMTASV